MYLHKCPWVLSPGLIRIYRERKQQKKSRSKDKHVKRQRNRTDKKKVWRKRKEKVFNTRIWLMYNVKVTLYEKCPNTELFGFCIWTEYGEIRSIFMQCDLILLQKKLSHRNWENTIYFILYIPRWYCCRWCMKYIYYQPNFKKLSSILKLFNPYTPNATYLRFSRLFQF